MSVDAIIVQSNGLQMDSSALTGEYEPIGVSIDGGNQNIFESSNVALSGAVIHAGNGAAVVFKTGDDSLLGKMGNLHKPSSDYLFKEKKVKFLTAGMVVALVICITLILMDADAWFAITAGLFCGFLPALLNCILLLKVKGETDPLAINKKLKIPKQDQ